MKIKQEMALPTCAVFAVLLFCLLLLSRCTPSRYDKISAESSNIEETVAQEKITEWHTAF